MSNTKLRNETKPNISGLVAISLSVGLFVYLSITMNINDRLENDLKREKLKSELFLSEKLSLEKSNLKLEDVILASKNANKIHSERLNNMVRRLSQAEIELRKARMESAPSLLLRKKNDETEGLKRKREKDSIQNAEQLVSLRSENTALEQLLDAHVNQTKKHTEELDRLRISLMNDVSIESARRNKRLTARASKTKRIMIAAAVSVRINDFTFRIINPEGKELLLDERNSSVKLGGPDERNSQALYVSPEIELEPTEKSQRIQIVYTAQSTLVPGEYKIFLYSENKPIGNFRLRLD